MHQALSIRFWLFGLSVSLLTPFLLKGQALDSAAQTAPIATAIPTYSKLTPPKIIRKGTLAVIAVEADTDTSISFLINGQPQVVNMDQGRGRLIVHTDTMAPTAKYLAVRVSQPGQQQPESFQIPVVHFPPWMALLPPLLAIIIALILKEVITALITGIFLGVAIMTGYEAQSWLEIFPAFLRVLDTYILHALVDEDHISIILFSLLIGGLVSLISKNGGMQGIVARVSRLAKTAKSGQLATWFLGMAVFFDDYANALVVGNTMRSITDQLRISREKLAYIVDSTAAPVSALAFISTWIAAELSYIEAGMGDLPGFPEGMSPYRVFLASLPYSFYPILALIFILILIFTQRDFGPMLTAERRARQTGRVQENSGSSTANEELRSFEPLPHISYHAYNAVIPIVVLVLGVLVGLIYTGMESLGMTMLDQNLLAASELTWQNIWATIPEISHSSDQGFLRKLGVLIGASSSYSALMWASLCALVLALIMTMIQRSMSLHDAIHTMTGGFKAMMGAMIILTLAWALQTVTKEMQTGPFLTEWIGSNLSYGWVPAVTFVLAALVAFSTGSSWSTMAILYPILIPFAWASTQHAELLPPEALSVFANVVASVLAGAVLGDHCSPISDTTILSSLATDCNHIDHVKTQLPYALTVGGVSLVAGVIPSAFGVPPMLCLLLSVAILYGIARRVGKPSM